MRTDTQAYPSISAVEAGRWDALTGSRPFASHAWFRFGERIHTGDAPLYLLAGRKGGEAAASALWLRRTEQLPISSGLLRFLVSSVLRRWPLLTCQTAVTGRSGLYLESGGASRTALLTDLVQAAQDDALRRGASFLLYPYLTEDQEQSPAWGEGFFSVSLPPDTYLPIVWPNFETYIRSRKNSARKDYRLHANRAERMGLETRLVARLSDPTKALRLIRRVEAQHRTAPNPWAAALIRDAGNGGCTWLQVELDGALVGCGLILKDRNRMALTLLGLQKGVPQVYFALMYGAVRCAIEEQADGIYGGGGAYTYKERLGYLMQQDSRVKVFAARPVLRNLGRWLAGREASPETVLRAWLGLGII